MDPTRNGLLNLAERRLHYLDRRQQVLAQNVANADTPGYQARDLVPFAQVLAASGRGAAAAPVQTNARHLSGAQRDPNAKSDGSVPERTLDGNAVSLDRQAVLVAETDQAHALAMNVYRKYMAMFRTALGRQA